MRVGVYFRFTQGVAGISKANGREVCVVTLRAAAWWDMVRPTLLSVLYCWMSAIHSSHCPMISARFR